ncbi:hypothetical protein CHU98_g1863 [Xylaria longipes]|nr:hypothetical protein CHU98_g1863 [Xylaria longipes]
MEIKGNALVVGGGGGIGRACAILLAKEGASGIFIADLDVKAASGTLVECRAIATNTEFKGKAVKVDITGEDSVRSLFSGMVQELGRIDYCINCAGIGVQETTDITSLSMAEFRRFLDINATGMFLVAKEASIVMRSQENQQVSTSNPGRGNTRGCIVNLGSASSVVASAGVLPYTVSKHAALGLTKNSGEFLGDEILWQMAYKCSYPTRQPSIMQPTLFESTVFVPRGPTPLWLKGQ